MDIRLVEIPIITLHWSEWFAWSKFILDARSDAEGLSLPNSSGVYEAKLEDTEERLTIGKASNLRMRIKQGLVKGKTAHSSGNDIRVKEDTKKIIIRWALTDRPSAVEEELHRQHLEHFGKLPKYTDRT